VGWWWCCWGKTCCFDSRARASPALRRRSPDRPAPPGSAMLRPVLPLAGHARAGLRFAGDSLRLGPLGEAAGRRAWPAPIPGSRSACFAPPFARRGRVGSARLPCLSAQGHEAVGKKTGGEEPTARTGCDGTLGYGITTHTRANLQPGCRVKFYTQQ
jgi:hypothetical protein